MLRSRTTVISEARKSGRPTVSRPVCPGVRPPLGSVNNFSFSLKFSLDSCGVYYFVSPSLTRGRVCHLILLLALASVILLGSESRGTQDDILLSQFVRLSQPVGSDPRIYIPQKQGSPVISADTGWRKM
jgi:hypothetical protein